MNIQDYPKAIQTINSIVNNKGIAEIKVEKGKNLVVVEVGRTIRISEQVKEEDNG